jgi:hypothetical protein
MCKFGLYFAIFLLTAIKGFGQYAIRELEDGEERPSGGLAKNEILLVGEISPSCLLQCSADKQVWKKYKLRYTSRIEVTLDEGYAYFYIQVVNNLGDDQKKYRLAPGHKYKLVLDTDTGVAIVKSGN